MATCEGSRVQRAAHPCKGGCRNSDRKDTVRVEAQICYWMSSQDWPADVQNTRF